MFDSVRIDIPRILVVATHADDEVLGAGGTIHRAITQWGAVVDVAIVADGRGARNGQLNIEELRKQARDCGSRLGVRDIAFGGLGVDPNHSIAPFETANFIIECLRRTEPNIVIFQSPEDVNIEHSIVNQSATYSVTRTEFADTIQLALECEIPSSTERNPRSAFRPSLWVPLLNENLSAKIEAFGAYEKEREPVPFGRSEHGIRTLAAYRGLQAGAHYCEAFNLVRGIV